jgi:hypothetical protein
VSTYTSLEARTVGEIPVPYREAWDDGDGVNLSLTGFTCTAKWRVNGGTQVTRSGSVDTATSTTTIVWQSGDLSEAGLMAGEVIVTDGTYTHKRPFQRVILPARGGV